MKTWTRAERGMIHELRVSELRRHFDDVVSLCEYVSRKYGVELTLEKAERVYREIQPCPDCGGDCDAILEGLQKELRK